jgi:hypothetical protein
VDRAGGQATAAFTLRPTSPQPTAGCVKVVGGSLLDGVPRAEFERLLYRASFELRAATVLSPKALLWVADYAFAASGSQMLILRVSGIRNRLSTKHTAGTAIG